MAEAGGTRTYRREIEDALDLLRSGLDGTVWEAEPDARAETPASALPGLLEQCRELAGPSDAVAPWPVMRSIHHFACTGGTLISRCIATMPNTQVLSEVDPLSPMDQTRGFRPTDLIGWFSMAPARPGLDILIEIFLGGLGTLARAADRAGLRAILRDHAHSHFCLGTTIPDRPTLREILVRDYEVRSLVTVRHPLESYLSLLKNDWVRIEPASLEEYARRYLAFLERYSDADLLRYEDFLAEPETWMQQVCVGLDLAYNPDFRDIFPAITLSGNSGRPGDVIEPRPRRPVPERVAGEAGESPAYAELCTRLSYDPTP